MTQLMAEPVSVQIPAKLTGPNTHGVSLPESVEYEPVSWLARGITLLAVIIPFAGLITAISLLWGWGLGWVEMALFAGMYLISGLGISVGFHRHFTHRSFETNRVVQFILGVFGSMAVQGPLFQWVATHRRHHQHSDQHEDPHSPHNHGKGVLGVVKGFWHSHIGWFFVPNAARLSRYVRDLRMSASLRQVSGLFPVWVTLGLAIPAALGGLLIGGWMGVFLGVLWGGLVRIFFLHHVTWSVNSVCHLWGGRPFASRDESRNNVIFGILGLGEGWHNNHHAFPTSARHGFRWWQIDISYWVIRGMACVGLAWNLKEPAQLAAAY